VGAKPGVLEAQIEAYCLTLPRSLHRPVAVVEGSLTRKANEIGVRLWTDCSAHGLVAARAGPVQRVHEALTRLPALFVVPAVRFQSHGP
jgi:hypothetical protein